MFSGPGVLENQAGRVSEELKRETGIDIPATTLSNEGQKLLTAANSALSSPTLVKDLWHEEEGLIRDFTGVSIGEWE